MRNISFLSEMSLHNNEISPVNAKIVNRSCVKRKFCEKRMFLVKSKNYCIVRFYHLSRVHLTFKGSLVYFFYFLLF